MRYHTVRVNVRTAACFQVLLKESECQCLEEIKELLSTLVLKFRKSASTDFQVLFIRLAIFFLLKVVLISVRETEIEGANNCLFLT